VELYEVYLFTSPFLFNIMIRSSPAFSKKIFVGYLVFLPLKCFLMVITGTKSTIRGLRQEEPLSPMLFIVVMDVLGLLFSKAEEAGLLQQLSNRKKLHIYADDVALFLHPTQNDISTTLDILNIFGKAYGLHNNAQKSNILTSWMSKIGCHVRWLPSLANIWVLLSLHKLTKQQLLPIVEKIANQLPSWKVDLLNKAGRRILVQHVLTGMTVYTAIMAIDFPKGQ
jgi:hypothetical protein